MLAPGDYFDLSGYAHAALWDGADRVWDALARLSGYLDGVFAGHGRRIAGEVSPHAHLYGDAIYIAEGAHVEEGATIHAPAWIGPDTEVRQGAYLRGGVVTGTGCVLGHTSEFKNAILLDGAKAAHFAYVGDSILGAGVNLGAGTVLSNLTVVSEKDASGVRPTISLRAGDDVVDTGLAKLGAILGDGAQTGCNCVTNPGCLIGPRTLVYACASVPKGVIGPDRMVKLRQTVDIAPRR